jgi:hypothetical protein
VWYELPIPRDEQDKSGTVEPPFLLCLRYDETNEQPVPALDDSGGCAEHLEYTYVREGYRLEVHRLDEAEIGPGCWPMPNDPDAPPEQEQPEEEGCLKPNCPCGKLVPLALIDFDDEGELQIDLGGRRSIPGTPQTLTHICGFNWEHGRTEEVQEFHYRHEHHELHRLIVHFDRPLRRYEEDDPQRYALGINAHTFLVQWKGDEESLEFIPAHPRHPPHYSPNLGAAVFVIDPYFLERLRGEITVYVTLRCDFILDEHGKPVDGDHLRGTVPTGNGIAGGTFESWFRLKKG